MKAKILFIVNPKSGVGRKDSIPELIDKYIDKDLFDYQIANTEYAGHATELAQQAAQEKIDIVAAIGGDGTVNEVGKALVNTDTAIAIIPTGSGNGLARHLAIPVNVKKSLQILNLACIHELDYGMINLRNGFRCFHINEVCKGGQARSYYIRSESIGRRIKV
mgnify:CR=1 FL=1